MPSATTTSSSSSYAAYLREVTLEVGACVDPARLSPPRVARGERATIAARTAVTVPSCMSSPRPRSASRHRVAAPDADDLMYDCVRVPETRSLSRSSAVRAYEAWQQQQQQQQQHRGGYHVSAHTTRTAALRPLTAEHGDLHRGSPSGGGLRCQQPRSTALTGRVAEEHRQRAAAAAATAASDRHTFRRLYAAMADEGRRHRDRAWPTAAAVYVPLAVLDDDDDHDVDAAVVRVGRVAAATGKAAAPTTSTDTSAITSSPARASSSPSSSSSSSSASAPRGRSRPRSGARHGASRPHRAVASRAPPAADTVRLRWPSEAQRSASAARGASTTRSRRCSRAVSPAAPRHRHRSCSDRAADARRGGGGGAVAVVSSTGSGGLGVAAAAASEAVLRDIASRTCACYWAEYPALPMATNPAAHAAGCPYQAHETLYTQMMNSAESESGDSASTRSRASSSALLERQGGGGHVASSRDAAPRQRCAHQRRKQQQQQQQQQQLAVSEERRQRGRGAVMGSAKRRTFMEAIMDAARDAPQPTARRGGAKVTSSPPTAAVAAAAASSARAPDDDTAPTPPPSPVTADAPLSSPLAESEKHSSSQASRDAPPPAEHAATTDGSGAGLETPSPTGAAGAAGVDADAGETAPPLHAAEEAESPLRSLSRPRRRPTVGVPGPGAYDVDVAYAAVTRGAVMAKAARLPPPRSITPGPGAYDVYKCEEEGRKAVVVAVAAAAAAAVEGGDAADPPPVSSPGPTTTSSRVAFASTGDRQLQLRHSDAFVPTAAWARRAAAVPGPGAYHVLDGDSRHDQSNPSRTSHAGSAFAKSADSAHYNVAAAATATAAAGVRASLPLPWCDWAGGAYVGTSTTAFVVHPSLAGGDRRAIGAPPDSDAAAAAATVVDAGSGGGGGAWRGVGSGVALRLTSLRFPVAAAAAAAVGSSRGGPGPAAYEVASGLRWLQRRAPAASLVFRHDRGPRGPLRSGDADADLACAVSAAPGPGTYDVHRGEAWWRQRGPRWSFGTAARHGSSSSGGGGGGDGAHEDGGHPGPGAYDTETGYRALLRGSTTTALLATATRFIDGVDDRVGPGTYDTEHGLLLLRTRVKGGVLPRAPRGAGGGDEDHDDRDDVGCGGPGPGAYTLPPLPPTGPTATLSTSATRFPWDAAAADVPSMPGPGSYDLAAATQIATRGGAIIGRAPRTSLLACTGTTATEVGPGRYTLPALPAGRAAVMTTVAAVGSGDEGERGGGGPGPGQYDPVDMNASTARSFTLARTAARFPASRAGSGEDGDGPGLGLYEVAAAAAATAAAPHGTFFATSARFPNDEGDRDAALVGPGSYDPYAMDGAAAVAHSLARAPRFPSDASTRGGGDGGVGPGAYEVVDLSPLGRGVVMGSAVARPADGGGAAAVPGPGAYSLQYTQVETAVPRVVLARAPAERGEGGGGRGGDVVPGPGQYDPEHAADQQQQQQHRRGYSFSAAPRSTMAVGHGTAGDVPGPGAYDARLTRDGHVVDGGGGGGGARFGTAPRHDGDVQRGGASASPGPGAYAPELHATANAGVAGAVSFTTAPRLVGGGVGDVPGPGTYDPTMTLQWPTAPSVSFPRSTTATTSGARGAADDATPGPGAYSVQAEAAATRGVPFGAAPRLAEISDGAAGAPGPAAYAPTDAATRPAPPAHRFATAARHVGVPEERTDVDGHVGPGAYDVAAGLARSSTMPSAAVYSIPRAGDAGDHGSVRGATVAAAAADASPGPGAYSLEAGYRATLPRAAAATLAGGADGGGSWRGDHDEASPGPGSYAPPPPAPLHGGISIPRAALAPPPDAATASPGPGAYDVAAAAAAAAAAGGALFGTAARWTIGGVSGDGASSSPLGPGAYSPNTSAVLKHTAAMSFAQAPRTVAQTTAAAADAVGPGAYDLPGDMATGAAAHRIGTAPRVLGVVADSAGVVGPGSYDVWTADAHVRPRAPAYTMAPPLPLTEALDAGQQPHPGPGSYDYPTDIHAHQRSALMLGRHGELAELAAAGRDTPGPGAYDAAAAYAATQLTQPQSCGVTIHGRPRPPATSAASAAEGAGPGPGAYAVEAVAATTAAHGFGTAARMPCAASGDTRVGPGAYDLPVQSTAPRAISFTQAPRAVSMAAAAAGAGDGDRGGGPGPGSYDVTTSAGAGGHAYTIPRGLRPVLRSGDVDASPCVGPGTYSPAGSTALPPGPSAAFGLAERPLNAAAGAGGNAVPGPGAYDPRHPGTIGATVARPSFGSAAREAGGAVEDTPGPGAYAVAAAATAVAPASRAVRVGTALRPPLALPSEAPGPGSYAVEADGVAATAGAVSFGRAPRVDALQHGSDHPGPGAYSHTALWGSHGGVSVGAAARPTAEVLHTTPGPGAYYRATGQATATTATFGSAAQRPPVAGAGVGTPGPGAYHTDAWGTSAATLTPGTVFGLAARPGPEPSTTPGPGTYWRGDIVAAPRGPSFAGPSTATLEARRRPTAADTLRKLASVGYPLLETPPAHA